MKKIIRGLLILSAGLALLLAGYLVGVLYLDINPQTFTFQDGSIAVQSGNQVSPTISRVDEGFEETAAFLDLFASNPPVFTQFTLQSPAAPSVEDYVALRKCIFSATCDFIDNRIDLSSDVIHEGQRSIRFFAVPPQGDYVSKSSLDTTLLHIAKGDQIWFSAYYYVAAGMPRTLADFETSALRWGPGPRLILLGDLAGDPHLGLELKHGLKPTYRQQNAPIPFPRDQWVHVVMHLELSNQDDGLIQIWQDCQMIVDARGKNLPKAAAILDRMQLGITATDRETELYLDDVDLIIGLDEFGLAAFCP